MLREVPAQVRNAATAEEAARALVVALEDTGFDDVQLWDPQWDERQTGQGIWRVVCEGATAGPDWGVALSLLPSAAGCRWGYLEPHWGFDVGFVEDARPAPGNALSAEEADALRSAAQDLIGRDPDPARRHLIEAALEKLLRGERIPRKEDE